MKKNTFKVQILTLLTFLLFSFHAQSANQVSIHLEQAGTLSDMIDESEKYTITDLLISGKLNGDDILFIHEMAGIGLMPGETTQGKLTSLDISDTYIVAGGGPYKSGAMICYTENNSISRYMFSETKLENLRLPESVTAIGYNALSDSSIKSITIPDKVTLVEGWAFYKCEALESVSFGKGLKTIDINAFYGCKSLESVSIPNNVTYIEGFAFGACTALKNLVFEPGTDILQIGREEEDYSGYVFTGCPFEFISIGRRIETPSWTYWAYPALKEYTALSSDPDYSVEDGILFDKNKTKLIAYPRGKEGAAYTMPNSVITIEDRAFILCTNLSSLILSEKLVNIGSYVFATTNIQTIILPNSVENIEDRAFTESSFRSIIIGSGIKTVGEDAFMFCTALEEIRMKADVPPQAFLPSAGNEQYDVDKNTCILYVPKNTLELYKAAQYWKEFKNIVEEDNASINSGQGSSIKVYNRQSSIVIENAAIGLDISIYSSSGILIKKGKAMNNRIEILVTEKGVYVIRVENQIFKVLVGE